MYTSFYNDRPFIDNEYQCGEWIEDSGLEPAAVASMLRAYVAENQQMKSPLLVANLYRILLSNARVAINERTMFPDRLNHGVGTYERGASWSVLEPILNERYTATFFRECHAIWAQRSMLKNCGLSVPDTDVWHMVYDWQDVIDLGAAGLLKRAKDQKALFEKNGELDEDKEVFLDSVIIAYEAIMTYIRRLRDESAKRSVKRYTEALDVLLVGAPETLYQVLCLCHIMLNVMELGKERCRTYGAIDVMYAPFYAEDIKSGRETDDSVREMFRYFFTKVNAEKRYADQPICLGKGWVDDDCDAAKLTVLMLEAYNELGIHNPKIHVMYKRDMSDKLLGTIAEMIRSKNSSLVIINEDVVLRSYEMLGIPQEDAQRYLPIGCYEMVLMGLEDARICAAWINLLKGCEYAITGGYDLYGKLFIGMRSEEPKSWEEFLNTYYAYLAEHCEIVKNNVNEQSKHSYAANPSPIYSGSIASCIEKGKDVFDGGMKYNNQSIKCFAIASAVDSLLAVKKFVYEDKKVTLKELRTALENNWKGYELLRADIMKNGVKYGNHIKEADDLAHDIYEFCAEHIIGSATSGGGVFRLGCDSVNMNDIYGACTGASADGRLSGEPLSKNMRPVIGMEKNGVSAFILSVCSINNDVFVDGAPLDFVMHPTAVEGDDGLDALKAVIRLFMKHGGMAFQGNILSLQTLLDAKAHPEKYGDLQVRVCGWNEYFVHMSEKVQNDFIKRVSGLEE